MPTQNLLRLLLLLISMLRNMLMAVGADLDSEVWSYVQTLSTRFGQDFEAEVQARFEAGV